MTRPDHDPARPARAVLRDGPIAGLLGSLVIAAFLGVWSMSSGQSPLHVASLLGSTLFADTAQGVTLYAVIAYTAAHTAALVVAGVLLAAVAQFSAAVLRAWFIAIVAVLLCAAHVLVMPIWFGSAVLAALPLWIVASATGLGLLAMSEYLWQRNAAPAVAVALQ